MKRLVMMVLVLVAVGGTTEVNAQSFLKKLGKKVENAAKNAIERNAERKTEDAVDKVFEGDFGKGKKDKIFLMANTPKRATKRAKTHLTKRNIMKKNLQKNQHHQANLKNPPLNHSKQPMPRAILCRVMKLFSKTILLMNRWVSFQANGI